MDALLETLKTATPAQNTSTIHADTAESFLADAFGSNVASPLSATPNAAASASLAAAVADTGGLAYRDIIIKEIETFRATCIKHDLAKKASQEAERRRLQMRKRMDEEKQINKAVVGENGDEDYMDGDYDSEEEAMKQERKRRDAQTAFKEVY